MIEMATTTALLHKMQILLKILQIAFNRELVDFKIGLFWSLLYGAYFPTQSDFDVQHSSSYQHSQIREHVTIDSSKKTNSGSSRFCK